MLALSNHPVPITAVPPGFRLRIVASAGAGFPSPAQDWEDDALSLIDLLRLDRAASPSDDAVSFGADHREFGP